MNEKDLNIEYICEKTLLNKDDELVPIILSLIQESYKAGLCQTEFDNTMNLIEENQELKSQLKGTTHCFDEEEHEILKKQLHEASLTIQEMVEQDIECPSNCEKLRQLKKQLEEYKKLGFKHLQDKNNILETQQKEFIKYLEDEIKELQKIKETELDYDILKDVIPQLLECEETLQNYKSIIGENDV